MASQYNYCNKNKMYSIIGIWIVGTSTARKICWGILVEPNQFARGDKFVKRRGLLNDDSL